MIVWRRVRALVVCLVGLSGCWSEQRVDDLFTEGEWDYLQTFRLDRLDPITCVGGAPCEAIARFGKQLFFDKRLSGPLGISSDLGQAGDVGKVACTTCHSPTGYFVDTRDDNAQSLGTKWTGRNVPGLVDLAYRTQYTWAGEYQAVEDVLELALRSKAAMNSTHDLVAQVVRDYYQPTYDALFPSDARHYENAKLAIGVYEEQLVSGPAPFDRYLDGDVTAIDIAAKRGAQLFIGKALCSECHGGPLFTDDQFHVTGVEQRGLHALPVDEGRATITMIEADRGRFRTPTLRHVAKTAPYMHAGQLETLTEVIDFYRWGGHPGGFVGVKDPRLVPLEIDDADAHDLEAFLMTLTGAPVDATWVMP